MPQVPIIIPIIVVGGLVGSLLKSRKQKIPRRKVLSWSLIAGLLNSGFALRRADDDSSTDHYLQRHYFRGSGTTPMVQGEMSRLHSKL